MRQPRHVAAALVATALLPAACSSGPGPGSGLGPGAGPAAYGPPALTAAQLTSRLVTASEAGMPGSAHIDTPSTSKNVITVADSFDETDGLMVMLIVQATPSAGIARGSVQLNRTVYSGKVGKGLHEQPFHIGDDSVEFAGIDHDDGSGKIDIYFARGAVSVNVSATRADDRPGVLPASARELVERIARAQDAKLK